jgi:acetoin utilization protein AcuB
MIETIATPQWSIATPMSICIQEEPLQVREVMTAQPVVVTPDTSIGNARRCMLQRQIRHLPVLARDALVGMISDRDLRTVLPSSAMRLSVWEINYYLDTVSVGEVMTRIVFAAAPDTTVTAAARRMLSCKIGALPVMEDARVVGILTRSDILQAFCAS